MALTAPPPRRALLSAADSLLLLLLGAAGSSHFLDKTQLTKKGDAHLKQEGIIRIHNSVAPSEPMKITSIPDVPQTPHQILGKENSTVPVYVPINSKGLILKCLTEKLLKQGINHPEYQWVGPMGLITKVYHKPGESLHLASEFKTESCETSAVVSFGKRLEDLKKLIHDLQCGIQQWNMQCHAATDTIAMITHKLTFQFVDPCESSDCENSSSCIKKAYTKIHQFLRVLRSQDHNQQMHYIPGSLTGLKIDHCKPGFGKNISNSTVCTECCIACPPGRISAEYNTVCTLCPPGSYNEKYGQTACKSCPKQHTTVRKGAKTASDCHRTLHIWIVFLVIPTGVIVVVLTSWVIIQLCCRRRLAVQYIEAEAELKTKLKTFANLATDAEIQAQRRKLRSPAKYDRKHLPKTKSGCLQEESRALLSNVTVTETSTPFGSDHFPDYTWPNKVETSFEEGISETTLGEE
ncbi:zona pellucida-binding protein 1-like isoform X2 [Dromaius novaehollandiae]|uniref:Zona pellucida-binding protein 1-like n=1 Tax=Dromaius novaehollandiae TaxID=8790 RepID=A0A8C4KBD9_DRONO|nr:zona pellucida-binding protein 1-like isoform X2 [Dromaius novaehollandiae]